MRIFVAVEDDLSLAFARRLIAEQPTLEIFREKVCGGFGALKRDIRKFDNMAKNGVPVFLITDLDNGRCPSQLTLEWLGSMPHPSLVFRVAVRESRPGCWHTLTQSLANSRFQRPSLDSFQMISRIRKRCCCVWQDELRETFVWGCSQNPARLLESAQNIMRS